MHFGAATQQKIDESRDAAVSLEVAHACCCVRPNATEALLDVEDSTIGLCCRGGGRPTRTDTPPACIVLCTGEGTHAADTDVDALQRVIQTSLDTCC